MMSFKNATKMMTTTNETKAKYSSIEQMNSDSEERNTDDLSTIDVEYNDVSSPTYHDNDDSKNTSNKNGRRKDSGNYDDDDIDGHTNDRNRRSFSWWTTYNNKSQHLQSSCNNYTNIPIFTLVIVIMVLLTILLLILALVIAFSYIVILQQQIQGLTSIQSFPLSTTNTPPFTKTTTTGTSNDRGYDDGPDNAISATTGTATTTITYDPSIFNIEWNPFHVNLTRIHSDEQYVGIGSNMISPTMNIVDDSVPRNVDDKEVNNDNNAILGYIMQPNMAQNQIVFVSEGNLYWTTLHNSTTNSKMTAIRLTYTVGNVRTPLINPTYPHLIAYTATYQARREIYIIDLRSVAAIRSRDGSNNNGGNIPSQRITYTDNTYGVTSIVGWNHDGTIITYSTTSLQVGLRDVRLYDIAIAFIPQNKQRTVRSYSNVVQVLETRPIPLSQAIDGVRVSKTISSSSKTNDDASKDISNDECLVFVRYKQGSHTVRYVGGTTEQLWLYCMNETTSVPLTSQDYIGTSKSPSIYTIPNQDRQQPQQRYLLFLSDRTRIDNDHPIMGPKVFYSNIYNNHDNSTTTSPSTPPHWRATTMNLWAVPLPNNIMDLYKSYYSSDNNNNEQRKTLFQPESMIQLTRISCQFNGMSLQEYSVDTSTGNVVLRVGADLYYFSSDIILSKLRTGDVRNLKNDKSGTPTATKIDSNNIHKPILLPIHILSDYHEQQERIVPINFQKGIETIDAFTTHFQTTSALLTVRGQLWVVPVLEEKKSIGSYQGSTALNIPGRRYRIIPGSTTGGAIRVITSLHIPLYTNSVTKINSASFTTTNTNFTNTEDITEQQEQTHIERRLSLVLATDPASATGEHAFYIVEIHTDNINQFNDMYHWPKPFIGGHVNGGSTKNGGLGSIKKDSVTVSPCGRRFAWADTDDRICVMTMPIYSTYSNGVQQYTFKCLPPVNDQNEPLSGSLSSLQWSPGGRYLGIEHHALNQFAVISIADCGNPEMNHGGSVADVVLGPVVQVTSSRFNSNSLSWGESTFDKYWSAFTTNYQRYPPVVPSTIYFLSDRDVITDVKSPWGSRAPSPHFTGEAYVYALSIPTKLSTTSSQLFDAQFPGGGTAELLYKALNKLQTRRRGRRLDHDDIVTRLSAELNGRKLRDEEMMTIVRFLSRNQSNHENIGDDEILPGEGEQFGPISPFPKDYEFDLPIKNNDLSFAQKAYRLPRIPKGKYAYLSVTLDNGFILLESTEQDDFQLNYYQEALFPSDVFYGYPAVSGIKDMYESTSRKHLCILSSFGKVAVIKKSDLSTFIQDTLWERNQADIDKLAISVWPSLEYVQMYNDAWRLMRDYFYDANLHNVNWTEMHTRYSSLVQRCGKREELDDVLGQLASETSALHSFVYGGEYNAPDPPSWEPASLGVFMRRSMEWKGYMISEIPQPDPDFDIIDGIAVYCPLSDQALRPTGQRGLAVGDVIVAINGESVVSVPDINMLLRGTVGRAIRLEVLRLKSSSTYNYDSNNAIFATTESIVAVPISTGSADRLRYNAWEWKTRSLAKSLAKDAGFSVGYIHMQAMDGNGEDAFARGYFPDHDKDALILDVRHNNGGNIDSWIISTLQRKAFMYWAPRSGNERFGELDWNEQFAFRGKLVVLVDELTSSDGEGVTRGLSELGLAKVIGTRTWGGGIWGSSVNTLVDGGIAAAPQFGIFNSKFKWGGGIEMTGLEPDIIVDNEPHMTFDGRDMQLERAIQELQAWIQKDPTPVFKTPDGGRPDMSLYDDCPA